MVKQDGKQKGQGSVAWCFSAQKHRLPVFVGGLISATAISSAVPASTSKEALFQTFCLALLALAVLLLENPAVFRRRKAADKGCFIRSGKLVCGAACMMLAAVFGGVFLAYAMRAGRAGLAALFAAAAGDPFSFVTAPTAFSADGLLPLIASAAFALIYTLLGACFEEALFRAAALDAFVPLFGKDGKAALKAAFLSSAIFAVLHLSGGEASIGVAGATGPIGAVASGGAAMLAWACLRCLQTGLFGFCLACLYLRNGRLAPLVAVHALFNLLYFGIPCLANGVGMVQAAMFASAPAAIGTVASGILCLPCILLLLVAALCFASFVFSSKSPAETVDFWYHTFSLSEQNQARRGSFD